MKSTRKRRRELRQISADRLEGNVEASGKNPNTPMRWVKRNSENSQNSHLRFRNKLLVNLMQMCAVKHPGSPATSLHYSNTKALETLDAIHRAAVIRGMYTSYFAKFNENNVMKLDVTYLSEPNHNQISKEKQIIGGTKLKQF